tara:strand:- start:17259 stop:17510 length:252 start_codon:yes stop_codon:yes gene_type:complete
LGAAGLGVGWEAMMSAILQVEVLAQLSQIIRYAWLSIVCCAAVVEDRKKRVPRRSRSRRKEADVSGEVNVKPAGEGMMSCRSL